MINWLFLLSIVFVCIKSKAQAKSYQEIEVSINAAAIEQKKLMLQRQQLNEEIKTLSENILKSKIVILKRFKSINSLNKYKWGELLINNNLNQLSINIKILKNISKYDFELFKNHLLAQKQLKTLENNLSNAELLVKSNLSGLNNQLMEFDKIEKIKKVHLLSNKLKSLLISKGNLSRPLVGLPVKEFGPSYDLQNSYYLVSSGETYKTKANTPIKTVGLGTLIFRDPLARWHETLIVQHDDNYYSVYAGVKNSKISVGDKLNQGQILGLAATDTFYFELRHYDYPINPKTWFSKE